MFYCNECKNINDWPVGVVFSHGKCEVCGKAALCNDVPSRCLPRQKAEYRTKTIEIQVRVCPDCDGDMKDETNVDARTLWHFICPNCNKKI
jgi:hypothetical protein